jgi:hypothetical protein
LISENALFLTEQQASELTGFSKRTFQMWRTKGGGPPFIRTTGSVRYERERLIDWMRAKEVHSTSELTGDQLGGRCENLILARQKRLEFGAGRSA